jgi:hypothetical protein
LSCGVKTKRLLATGLLGLAVVAVWNVTVHRRQAEAQLRQAQHAVEIAEEVRAKRIEAAVASVRVEPEEAETAANLLAAVEHRPVEAPVMERQPVRPSPATEAPRKPASKKAVLPAQPVSQSKQRELGDPVARIALSLVGQDPDAEAYWVDAINDPSLSAHERSDLIEDLNEEGFEDPHHPTFDDLPIIVSRLELIEELAPDAMDEVNSDAFAEAWKDLAKMALIAEQN